ncbi:MAG TPA: serine/threonine-protein kinase [Polyangiaceae bacterium]
MSLQPGQILDNKYRVVRLIGEGGMGAVFEGENTLIKRRVAIKAPHAQAAGHEATLVRFEREAQAAGRIGSDHILEIIDLGVLPGGERYMVMEFLEGEPLSGRIRQHGRLSPAQLYPLMRQALVGLQAAHRAGIVHRDLKPDNIFILNQKLGHKDFVKLIDFGISKFNVLGGDMAMTRTGAVMGTPYYMSPEQAKGASNIDARSDIYTMGVIAYEALAGQVPFDGSTFNELMFKIVLSTPRSLAETVPGTDSQVIALIDKAMAREPADRYQSAEEFITALDNWAAATGIPATGSPFIPQRGALEVQKPAATSNVNTGVVARTGSSWASSQTGDSPAQSGKKKLVVAAAAGVAITLAGVALAIKLSGGDAKPSPESAASSEASAVAAAPPPAPATPEPTKPTAEPLAPAPATSEPAVPAPAASSSAAPAVAPSSQAPAVAVRRGVAPRGPAPQPKTQPTQQNPAPSPKTKEREFGY